jgi:deoxyribodipyrimidine photo-lyase
MPDTSPVIVWFRQDLRLADNPALRAAAASGRPVIPVYILDDDTPGSWRAGGAARWWLHHSLSALLSSLEDMDGQLILRQGSSPEVLEELVKETEAGAVYWNRCYEPYAIDRDKGLKIHLKEKGCTVESFNGSLLFEPWQVETKAGGFYKVYTRYWQAVRAMQEPPLPESVPDKVTFADAMPESDDLESLSLLPTQPDWAGGLRDAWVTGEAAAMERLDDFLSDRIEGYKQGRDFPADPATSNLSPYLHIGNISPRQIWARTLERVGWTAASEAFLKEVVWREFAYHVLYHLPTLPDEPMYEKFAAFPWEEDADALKAWQMGQTGYPMVDAGMRELWQTGQMHNRVRMIAASFLVKHLLQPWQQGEAWFWDTLVDADLAANAFNWQWVAGCGADAAPYFRIFNPITQGAKFDPEGEYVRKYVPEIAALPDKYLFSPWEAPDNVLKDAGVVLDETYPRPIIGHKQGRERALEAFKSLPSSG